MPVYEYKCRTCGKEFEYTQRITEDAIKKCPPEICEEELKGQGKVERMISKNIGLVFKGSGFYLTDYVHKKDSQPQQSSTDRKNESQKVDKRPDPSPVSDKPEVQTSENAKKTKVDNSSEKTETKNNSNSKSK